MAKGKKNRLFLHSFLGIVLGVSVGGLVLWFLLDDSGTRPPPTRRVASQAPATRSAAPARARPIQDKSKASMRELYRQSLQEAREGRFGPTMNWLHQNRKGFVLWVHLYWQLAEGSLQAGKPLQAAGLFTTLLKQNSHLWSPRLLQWRIASAKYQAGKKSEAKKLLAKLVRMKRDRKRRGWLWRQQDRHAMAEALWQYAQMQRGKSRFLLWQRLWLDYPESPRAPAAEKRWWREWRKRRPGTSLLLTAASRYIDAYGDLDKAKTILRSLKRKARRRRYKAKYREIWVAHSLASANGKEAWRDLRKYAKTKRRSRRGKVYYQMAQVALKFKRRRTFNKTMRTLRRRSRYWYAQALVAQGRQSLVAGRSRSAKRAWRKAWRKSRSREMRMQIYLYRGLNHLRGSGRRNARRARSSFNQAARWFRKMRKREKRSYPPGMIAYWKARADLQRGRKSSALKAWHTLFRQAPFSFYGQLSAQRLQVLGKLPPLKTKGTSKNIWQPAAGSSRRARILRLLQAEGPPALLALELEALAVSQRNPKLSLLMYLAQHSQPGTQRSNALLWLHQRRDDFLNAPTLSRDLLMTAYPLPDKRWPTKLKEARKYALDGRLIAALLLHKRGFHPDTRRSERPGPAPDPLWLKDPLNPPHSFSYNCRKLRDLLQTFMDPGLAIEGLLTQNSRKVQRLKKTFGDQKADLRYPLMSAETRAVLQTYWIYRHLYLQ